MKFSKIIPYFLPLLTILVLGSILFINPSLVGFTIRDGEARLLSADVALSTQEGEFLPAEAIVFLYLDDIKKDISVKEFIEKSGGEFMIIDDAYTGDYLYSVKLDDIMDNPVLDRGDHEFRLEVVYNGFVLSSDEKTIVV